MASTVSPAERQRRVSLLVTQYLTLLGEFYSKRFNVRETQRLAPILTSLGARLAIIAQRQPQFAAQIQDAFDASAKLFAPQPAAKKK